MQGAQSKTSSSSRYFCCLLKLPNGVHRAVGVALVIGLATVGMAQAKDVAAESDRAVSSEQGTRVDAAKRPIPRRSPETEPTNSPACSA